MVILLLGISTYSYCCADPVRRAERKYERLERRALRRAYRYDERTDRRRDNVATFVVSSLMVLTYVFITKEDK